MQYSICMNHILKLQQENQNLTTQLKELNQDLTMFLQFLNSSKFTGTENGERKDWIATGDVASRLIEMRMKCIS